jgi:hypothetical protein
VPTRAVRSTKAEPQPCAAASLPTVDSNHDQRVQSAPSCRLNEWALLELRAPPETRTPFPDVRDRCITRYACGACEPYRGLNPDDQFGRLVS